MQSPSGEGGETIPAEPKKMQANNVYYNGIIYQNQIEFCDIFPDGMGIENETPG
jgi:hypothetical protein